jgi:WD40 repeat protein
VDGRLVVTGSLDQTARIWDTDSGRVVRNFTGHAAALRFAAISSDNQLLLTGDFDAAYLWLTDLQAVIDLACSRLTNDFSLEERLRYGIGDNRDVCAN